MSGVAALFLAQKTFSVPFSVPVSAVSVPAELYRLAFPLHAV
jgi:hypothetical protein